VLRSRMSVSLFGQSSNSLAFPSVTHSELLLLPNLSQSPVPLDRLSEHLWQPRPANLCLTPVPALLRQKTAQRAPKTLVTGQEKSQRPESCSGRFETVLLVRPKVIKMKARTGMHGPGQLEGQRHRQTRCNFTAITATPARAQPPQVLLCSDSHTSTWGHAQLPVPMHLLSREEDPLCQHPWPGRQGQRADGASLCPKSPLVPLFFISPTSPWQQQGGGKSCAWFTGAEPKGCTRTHKLQSHTLEVAYLGRKVPTAVWHLFPAQRGWGGAWPRMEASTHMSMLETHVQDGSRSRTGSIGVARSGGAHFVPCGHAQRSKNGCKIRGSSPMGEGKTLVGVRGGCASGARDQWVRSVVPVWGHP